MICKFFEKHVLVEGTECGQKIKNEMELDYYLLESRYDDDDNQEIQKAYGVEIIKKQNGKPDEKKHYESIFPSRDKAKSLIELLAEQTVTPSTLSYVLDDILGM